jgi:hypothetical protein
MSKPANDANGTLGAGNGTASPALPAAAAGTHTPQSGPSSQNGAAPNTVHNKLLEHVIRTPERQPSPQPTHLSVPGVIGSHTLKKEEGPGYVAPKFEGKARQMEEGECTRPLKPHLA